MSPTARHTPAKPGRPPTGRAVPAAERMRRMRARRKAAGLRPVTRWMPAKAPNPSAPVHSDHRLHDLRSLAMHTVIAARIDRDPTLLDIARRNLKRWRARFGARPDYWWLEWDQLLRRPWTVVAALLTDPGENATRLRQSSPFVGVLTAPQRRKIYDAFRA